MTWTTVYIAIMLDINGYRYMDRQAARRQSD
jgi:hypothetical protein